MRDNTTAVLATDQDAELAELREENTRLRDALSNTQLLLKSLSETTNEMYWRTDVDHRFTYMSDLVVQAVDVPMSGQIGRTRAELSDDDLSAPHWIEHLEDLRAHRPFKNFHYIRRHSNGDIRHISTSGQPMFDEAGNFDGFIGVAADITERLEIENKARYAEANLYAAVNALDAMMSLWGPDDRLVMCNDKFRKLNARILDKCVPGTLFEDHIRALVTDKLLDPREDGEGWVENRLARRKNPSGPFEMLRENGEAILIYEARLPDGSMITMAVDITPQKNAERALRDSEQRMRDFGDTAADWFWEMDEDLRFSYISVVSDDILDAPEAEQNLPLGHEIILEGLSELQSINESDKLSQRQPFNDIRFSRTRSDGERVHMSVSGKPIFDGDGRFLGYRGVGRDISDLLRAQEALQLEKDRAEDASRAKSQFLAHMSHELRTPLNAILGFSDILREQLFGPLGADSYVDYANDIHGSGEHLLSLINDLLDIAKIEAGKQDIVDERINIETAIDKSLRLFSHRLVRRKIETVIEIDDTATHLNCDRRALSQIFFNLISNAEKFGREQGEIKITSSLGEDGGVRISVSDDGRGFKADELKTVLSPFGRIENPMTKSIPGSGLGLPIVNGLIEMHGGRLEIQSEVDKGTSVTSIFPPDRTPTAS